MRLMLDSSIVIDYLKTRDPFYAGARKLKLLGFLAEHELWFSSAQANDVFYTVSMKLNSTLHSIPHGWILRMHACTNARSS